MPIAEWKSQVHRGGRAREGIAENSTRAFQASVRDRADFVELDAQAVEGGAVMVSHGWADDMNKLTNMDGVLNEFIKNPGVINQALNNQTFLTSDWPRIRESLVSNDFLRDKTWIQGLLRGQPAVGNLAAMPFNGANVDLTGILARNELPSNFPDGLNPNEIGALKELYLQHKHPIDLRPLAAQAGLSPVPVMQGEVPPATFQPANLNPNQIDALRSLYLFSVAGADLNYAANIINGPAGRPVQLTDFDMSIDAQRQGLDALRHMYMEQDPNYLANLDPSPERIVINDAAGITAALTTPGGMPVNSVNGVDLRQLVAIVNPPPPGVARNLDVFDMDFTQLKALETLYFSHPTIVRTENPIAPGAGVNVREVHTKKLEDPNGKGIIHMPDYNDVVLRVFRLKAPDANGDLSIISNDKIPYLHEVYDGVHQERRRDPYDDGSFGINNEIKEAKYYDRNPANHPTRPFAVRRHPLGHAQAGEPIQLPRDIANLVSTEINNFLTGLIPAPVVVPAVGPLGAGIAAGLGVGLAPPPAPVGPQWTKANNFIVSSFDQNSLGQMKFSDPDIPRSALISSFTARDWRINPQNQRVEHRLKQDPTPGTPDYTPGPWIDARPEITTGAPGTAIGSSVLPQDALYKFTDQRVIDTIANDAHILRDPNHPQYAEKYEIIKDWKNDIDTERTWDFTRAETQAQINTVRNHVTLDVNGNALVDPITLGNVLPDPSMISISVANLTPIIANDIHALNNTTTGQRLEAVTWTTNEISPDVKSPEHQRLQMESFDQLDISGFITDHASGIVRLKEERQILGMQQAIQRQKTELIAALSAQEAALGELLTYGQSLPGAARRPAVAEVREEMRLRQDLITDLHTHADDLRQNLDSTRVLANPGAIPVALAPQIPQRVGRRTDITAPNTLLNPALQPMDRGRSALANLVSTPKNIITNIKNLKSQNFEQQDRNNVAAKLAIENNGVAVKMDEKKAKSNDTIVGRPFYVNSEGELFVKMPPPTGVLANVRRRPGNPLPTVIIRIKPDYHGILTPEGQPDLHKLNELVSNADRQRVQNPGTNLDVTFKTHNVPGLGRGTGGGRGGA